MKRDIPIICDDGQYIYDNENGYAYNTFLSLCEEFDYFENDHILYTVGNWNDPLVSPRMGFSPQYISA